MFLLVFCININTVPFLCAAPLFLSHPAVLFWGPLWLPFHNQLTTMHSSSISYCNVWYVLWASVRASCRSACWLVRSVA